MNSMHSVPQPIAPVRPPVVVTVVSKKGGSGKTSTIMVLASAAAHLGLRVHILDGDRDPQLVRWRANAEAFDWGNQTAPLWPQAITAEKLAATIDDVATQNGMKHGSVRFRVFVEDRDKRWSEAFRSEVVRGDTISTCRIKVAPANRLALVVDWADRAIEGDEAVWLNPRFLQTPAVSP